MKTLLLNIPVLHQGYISLFDKVASTVDRLAIIDSDIINDFPELAREVRAVKPALIKQIIDSTALFKEVVLVNKKQIRGLTTDDLLMADEDISDQLIKKYSFKKVKKVSPFLRWDTKNVQTVNEVSPDRTISKKKFDQEMIRAAEHEANRSSDWYRQVGAVVVKNGTKILQSFNQRQPTAHSPYIDGDPRNFLPIGSKTELRTTLHAEQAVIVEAAKKGISLDGASIYVTTFPCPDCAQLIAHSGIKKCYYSSGYSSLDGERELKAFGVEVILVQ